MILREGFDDSILEVLDNYSLARSMQRAKTGNKEGLGFRI
jgi:hypothetical protein